MKNLLEFIVKSITGSDGFTVEEKTEENYQNLLVLSPKEYMGIIIGKNGKTIKNIRNILKVRATIDKIGFSLSVEEKSAEEKKDS